MDFGTKFDDSMLPIHVPAIEATGPVAGGGGVGVCAAGVGDVGGVAPDEELQPHAAATQSVTATTALLARTKSFREGDNLAQRRSAAVFRVPALSIVQDLRGSGVGRERREQILQSLWALYPSHGFTPLLYENDQGCRASPVARAEPIEQLTPVAGVHHPYDDA
jgi:hypothetical protein